MWLSFKVYWAGDLVLNQLSFWRAKCDMTVIECMHHNRPMLPTFGMLASLCEFLDNNALLNEVAGVNLL